MFTHTHTTFLKNNCQALFLEKRLVFKSLDKKEIVSSPEPDLLEEIRKNLDDLHLDVQNKREAKLKIRKAVQNALKNFKSEDNKEAIRLAQQALNLGKGKEEKIVEDNIVGQKTIEAVNNLDLKNKRIKGLNLDPLNEPLKRRSEIDPIFDALDSNSTIEDSAEFIVRQKNEEELYDLLIKLVYNKENDEKMKPFIGYFAYFIMQNDLFLETRRKNAQKIFNSGLVNNPNWDDIKKSLDAKKEAFMSLINETNQKLINIKKNSSANALNAKDQPRTNGEFSPDDAFKLGLSIPRSMYFSDKNTKLMGLLNKLMNFALDSKTHSREAYTTINSLKLYRYDY